MKLMMVVVVGWMCGGCSLIKTSSGTTTPNSNGGTTTTSSSEAGGGPREYNGPDAVWMPDVLSKVRSEAEELLHEKGFTGPIAATGDLDPAHVQDELVCEQTPKFGKYQPSQPITLKFCNGYRAPNDGPVIVGLSVDEAKKKAVAAGFTGQIEVMEMYEYDATCKAGNVCQVTPTRWYLNQEHRMQLMVNKTIKLSTPD